MYTLKLFLTSLYLLFSLGICAQIESDSISSMPEVVVKSNRLNFTTGSKVEKIDSVAIHNLVASNLGDLLSQHSRMFVKSYGLGQMSSISSRGTNANHTAILWNGFNLQGPTLGQSDFSTIPVYFLDDVNVQYGSASALFGSGAIGGVIHLNNTESFNKGHTLALNTSVSSYENIQGGINYELSKKRYICKIKYFNKYGENDFPISKITDKKLQHAEVKQNGLLAENYFKINKLQQINLRIWLQDLYREIPADNVLQSATNQNTFYRLSSEWKRVGKANSYYIRTGYFNELYDYNDGQSFKTLFQSVISEAEGRISIKQNQSLNIGINNTYHEAKSLAYENIKSQNRSAIFTSYKINNLSNTWNLSATLRQEVIGFKRVPIVPTLGFQGTVIKGITLRGIVSKSYRLPSFNDLYWAPNGNINLLPELGWSQELGITAKKTTGMVQHEADIALFNSNIKNWIIWLPKSGRWTPQNIQEVWSRGFETTYKLVGDINDFKFRFSLDYSYTLSTNEKATSLNDESKNKQLIYVPIYKGGVQLGLEYKSYTLSYLQTSIGNRFTSSDNTEYIKGYQIANVILNKTLHLGKVRAGLNLQLNNIFNVEYQVVLARPMPLRNYQIGMNIYFNQPNK